VPAETQAPIEKTHLGFAAVGLYLLKIHLMKRYRIIKEAMITNVGPGKKIRSTRRTTRRGINTNTTTAHRRRTLKSEPIVVPPFSIFNFGV